MKLLRLKYKAHRLVNIVFYGIFFIAGFILGKLNNSLIDVIKNLFE